MNILKIKQLSKIALQKQKIFELMDMNPGIDAEELRLAKLEMINANYKLHEAIKGETKWIAGK